MNWIKRGNRSLRLFTIIGLLTALCLNHPVSIAAFAPAQPAALQPAPALVEPVSQRLPEPDTAVIVYSVDLTATQNTYIVQNKTSTNYGNCTDFITQYQPQDNRALIQFDLSSIPADAVILTATLRLYQSAVSAAVNVRVNRITNDWAEGSGGCSGASGAASWNSRQSGVNWTTAGGDFDPTALYTLTVGNAGFYSWTITAQVGRWIAGTQPNYGLLLVQISGASNALKTWASRTNGTTANRPILRISYVYRPSITSLALYQADRTTPAASMNPQIEYAIGVGVHYSGTLANLSRVTVTLFYDADLDRLPATVPNTGNTQNAAIMVWKSDTSPNWTIDPSSNTTWSLLTSQCGVVPDLNATSGVFWFHVKPGKVATQATAWNLYAVADNGSGYTSALYDPASYTMNWYGEIILETSVVDWGTVMLGSDFTANVQSGIVITYISNSAFKEQVKTDGTWNSPAAAITLNSAGTPGNAQFSLKAYYTNTYASAFIVTALYQTQKTGTQTAEAGLREGANTLWLRLGSTGMPVATYSGVIYFNIVL